jgi:hypothetical protein
VRFVELQVGAHVDHQGARQTPLVELAGGERERLHALGDQRPAVELDDRLEVRRLGTQLGERPLHETLLVGLAQQLVVGTLVPDR